MSEEDYIRKYSGHWFLKTDEDKARHAIKHIKHTLVLKNDDYTKGYIDACKAIEIKFNALIEEERENV
jgi:hypothetical protein